MSAFTFALAGIIGGVVMLLTIVYVPILFAYAGYSYRFEQIIAIARWPLLALLVLGLLAALYRFGPCRRSPKWRWVSVGSVFSTTLWLIASAGFSFYVAHFAQYDRIYGSLGAVIVLLFWLYLSFYIILLGAEINAELELQTAQDTTRGKIATARQTWRLRRRSRGGRTARQPAPGEPGRNGSVQGRGSDEAQI